MQEKAHGKSFLIKDKTHLRRALKAANNVRAYRRIQGVLLVAEGKTTTEAARVVLGRRQSVRRWVNRYLRHRRISDLYDRQRQGRPSKAAIITSVRILREVRKNPMDLGYMSTVWTVPLLATHLSEKFGTPITPRTLRRRMKEAGLAWKRPRYVYHERADNIGQKKGP